ncbi:MAG: hypothetical protein WEB04_12190 [Dehalococcoidia bacterium]
MGAAFPWRQKEEALRRAKSATCLWSREQLQPYCDLIDESISRLGDLMPPLFGDDAGVNKWTPKEKAIRTLSAWTFGRLVGARESALDGYLVDAVMLARAAFESLLLIIAFDIEEESDPPDSLLSGKWVAGKFVGQRAVRKFLVNNVGPELSAIGNLYSGLSNLSHAGHIKSVLLQSDLVERADENAYQFRLAGVRKPTDLRVVMHFIWYQALILLGYLPLAVPSLDTGGDIQVFANGMIIKCDELQASISHTN